MCRLWKRVEHQEWPWLPHANSFRRPPVPVWNLSQKVQEFKSLQQTPADPQLRQKVLLQDLWKRFRSEKQPVEAHGYSCRSPTVPGTQYSHCDLNITSASWFMCLREFYPPTSKCNMILDNSSTWWKLAVFEFRHRSMRSPKGSSVIHMRNKLSPGYLHFSHSFQGMRLEQVVVVWKTLTSIIYFLP